MFLIAHARIIFRVKVIFLEENVKKTIISRIMLMAMAASLAGLFGCDEEKSAYSGETCHPFREKTCHFLNNFKLKLSKYLVASFVQNFFPFFFA